MNTRNVNSLAVLDYTACHYITLYALFAAFDNGKLNCTVIQKYATSCFKLFREICVGDSRFFGVSEYFIGNKSEDRAVFKLRTATLEFSESDFGSLCVKHYRTRSSETFSCFLERVDDLFVFLVSAVREIETGYIHSGQHHFLYHFGRI